MKSAVPKVLPQFEKCPQLWDERFRPLVQYMRTYALLVNAPTMARRLEECEDEIVELLLTGKVGGA